MAKLSKFMDSDVPRIVGVEATKFFKDRFIKQGWEDAGFEPWKARKMQDRRSGKRKLLVKSGALMNSINYEIRGNKVIVSSRDIPYAKIHNDGGTINTKANVRQHTRSTRTGRTEVKSHSRNMNITIPKRQFIGSSKALDKIIEQALLKRIKHILNT